VSNQCHGSKQTNPLFKFIMQGECGSAELHDQHPFTDDERLCTGSPFDFAEADCGRVGPHSEHPLNQPPTTAV
jgi:hypothetical protein